MSVFQQTPWTEQTLYYIFVTETLPSNRNLKMVGGFNENKCEWNDQKSTTEIYKVPFQG